MMINPLGPFPSHAALELPHVSNRRPIGLGEFKEALVAKQVTLAWPDNVTHRILFKRNRYGIITADLYRVWPGKIPQQDRLEAVQGATDMAIATDGQRMIIKGGPSQVGTYKYPLRIMIPIKRAFLNGTDTYIRANLRWSHNATWHSLRDPKYTPRTFVEPRTGD